MRCPARLNRPTVLFFFSVIVTLSWCAHEGHVTLAPNRSCKDNNVRTCEIISNYLKWLCFYLPKTITYHSWMVTAYLEVGMSHQSSEFWWQTLFFSQLSLSISLILPEDLRSSWKLTKSCQLFIYKRICIKQEKFNVHRKVYTPMWVAWKCLNNEPWSCIIRYWWCQKYMVIWVVQYEALNKHAKQYIEYWLVKWYSWKTVLSIPISIRQVWIEL